MKKISSLKTVDFCAIFLITLLICIINVTNTDLTVNPDLRFLYNRALQMYNCLCDGNIPFFYYNDFGGVGYGSAFFYGDLTLYPFLLFVKFGIAKFLLFYISATIILTYLGVVSFAKKFTSNAKFIGLIYISCCYTLQSFYSFGTYANLFAIALSFFFLAQCINYFRDSKNFIKASILFYLILNTHTITAVISFLACCYIFVVYFDKSRLKSYIKFALLTCLLCSYFIINVLYHSDILTNINNINETMLDYAKRGDTTVILNYMSYLPFIGTVELIILTVLGIDIGLNGVVLCNTLTLVILLICLFKRRKSLSKCEIICFLCAGVLIFIAERHIWVWLNEFYAIPFQFPTRYLPYVILVLLVICFRSLSIRKVKAFLFLGCLVDCFLISFMTGSILDDGQYTDLFCQVENGEYLDESFVWETESFYYYSSHVTDQDGNEYAYSIDKDKVIVDLSGIDTSKIEYLTLPKLYYRGYQCYNNKKLKVSMGYSQFIQVGMTDFSGTTLTLQYVHPYFLKLLYIFCNGLVLYLIVHLLFVKFSKSKGSFVIE